MLNAFFGFQCHQQGAPSQPDYRPCLSFVNPLGKQRHQTNLCILPGIPAQVAAFNRGELYPLVCFGVRDFSQISGPGLMAHPTVQFTQWSTS
ncbi:hypothetical protein PoB_006616800 [Plakobranchus ocellatus]|uniref:Uncharacterized protein n=1 Tax=Plakobranchus ocellatus TaxID=259542 RepID=A0AAV4D686_9GAST|nr:hypothetical protein PoB_006616800 [Plakobranchus ocellatus]